MAVISGGAFRQLRELQKSTEDLNGLTDKANEVVRRTETFLAEKCRVGKRASVDAPCVDEEEEDGRAGWLESMVHA
jgi:hypothetical protein